MKRLFLILALCLTATVASAADYRMGGRPEREYWVIASNAPAIFRRGGPGVRLCDGITDDVEIRAAIAEAEATGVKPTVKLSPGTYDIDAPLYIGYTLGRPNQKAGCSLECAGYVILDCDIADSQLFAIYFSPAAGGRQVHISGPMQIQGGTRAGGIYTTGLTKGYIRNVRIDAGRVAGLWADNSWTSELSDLYIISQWGAALGLTEFNAGLATRISADTNSGYALGSAGYQGINRYEYDATSDPTTPFWPGEKVKLTNDAGAVMGVLLAVDIDTASAGAVWIGHANLAAFTTDQVIYGDDSGATCTVNGAETDVGSMIYAHASSGYITDVTCDGNNYADQVDGTDFPLVYVDSRADDNSRNVILEKFRFEGNTSETLPLADLRRGANTYFRIDHADGTVIRDLYVFHKGGGDGAAVRDLAVTVDAGGDGTSTVTLVDANLISTLATGDKVQLWSGGANDGEYTVEAGFTGTTFGISDGDFTEAPMYCWAKTASVDRLTPDVLVDIIDCEHVLVENVKSNTFQTAYVRIDANCTNCEVRNILPMTLQSYQNTEGTFFYYGKHGVIVSDAGAGTKVSNVFTPNYTALKYVGGDKTEVIDEVSAGKVHTTTIVCHNSTVIHDAGVGDQGWGTEVLYTFPQGHVQILGVVCDLVLDASVVYDPSDIIAATDPGDFAIGTTAITDETIAGTEADIVGSTGFALVASVADAHGTLTTVTPFDGTVTAKTLNLNVILDAGVDADTAIGFKGTVTVHWVFLGELVP